MDYRLELVLIPVSDVDRASFADFSDPDGNIWILQEVDRSKADHGAH